MHDIVVASINQIVLWFLCAIVLINFVFSINWFVFFVLAIGSLIFIIKGKKSGFVTSMNWFIPFLLAVGILVFIANTPFETLFLLMYDWFIPFVLVVGILIFIFIARGKGTVEESILLFLKITLPIQAVFFLISDSFFVGVLQIDYKNSLMDDILPLFHLSTGIAPFVFNKSKIVKLVISLFIVVIVIRYGVHLDNRLRVMLTTEKYVGQTYWAMPFIFELYCFFTNLGVLIYMWKHKTKGV